MGLPAVDHAPAGLRRQVEAEQVVVALRDLLGDGPVPELLGQPVDLVVEHVGEALEEEEGQQVVLELGRVLCAPDGACGVPQHLLHGLGGRDFGLPAAPPGHAGGGLRFVDARPGCVDSGLGSQRGDGRPRRPLGHRRAALPPVHRRERHAKPLGKLLLRQVQPGADGLEGRRDSLPFCYICHICSIAAGKWEVKGAWYPCPDSNRGTRFRKPLLYPPELQGPVRG